MLYKCAEEKGGETFYVNLSVMKLDNSIINNQKILKDFYRYYNYVKINFSLRLKH